MLKKIETILNGVGELSLPAMASWFPGESIDDILLEISKSEKLSVQNGIIIDKSKKNKNAENNIINKKINLAMQANDIEEKSIIVEEYSVDNNINKMKSEENLVITVEASELISDVEEKNDKCDISYFELIELIDNYNKKVKMNYKKVVNKSFENTSEAILRYYKKRFNIIINDFDPEDGGTMYSLIHKKTGIEVAYLYIGEFLGKATLDKIAQLFEFDTVYFCITKDADVSPNLSTREFYLKDVEEITEEYISRYRIVESKVGVLKIEEGKI